MSTADDVQRDSLSVICAVSILWHFNWIGLPLLCPFRLRLVASWPLTHPTSDHINRQRPHTQPVFSTLPLKLENYLFL